MIVDTVGLLRPAALVLAAVERARLEAMEPVLQGLPPETAVWFAGAGADEDMAEAAARACSTWRLSLPRHGSPPARTPGRAGRRSSRVGGSGALLEPGRAPPPAAARRCRSSSMSVYAPVTGREQISSPRCGQLDSIDQDVTRLAVLPT